LCTAKNSYNGESPLYIGIDELNYWKIKIDIINKLTLIITIISILIIIY